MSSLLRFVSILIGLLIIGISLYRPVIEPWWSRFQEGRAQAAAVNSAFVGDIELAQACEVTQTPLQGLLRSQLHFYITGTTWRDDQTISIHATDEGQQQSANITLPIGVRNGIVDLPAEFFAPQVQFITNSEEIVAETQVDIFSSLGEPSLDQITSGSFSNSHIFISPSFDVFYTVDRSSSAYNCRLRIVAFDRMGLIDVPEPGETLEL